jgi:septal ring factor EnvC (AmiA/AmiB activator)
MKTLFKTLFMKPDSETLDIKSIMIVVLFVISGIFFTQWYFGGENHRKERIDLQKQNKELQKQKEDLSKDFDRLRKKFEKDSTDLEKIKIEIKYLDIKLKDKDAQIYKANKDLKDFKAGISKTKAEIQDLKDNPIKRTGDNLLESIKEKTK